MEALRRTVLAGFAAALLSLVLALPALAHGPQSLPEAACNAGTGTAHGSLGPSAMGHDRIPHDHGFGCVHLKPTASH
jgi:hypothetical protein